MEKPCKLKSTADIEFLAYGRRMTTQAFKQHFMARHHLRGEEWNIQYRASHKRPVENIGTAMMVRQLSEEVAKLRHLILQPTQLAEAAPVTALASTHLLQYDGADVITKEKEDETKEGDED